MDVQKRRETFLRKAMENKTVTIAQRMQENWIHYYLFVVDGAEHSVDDIPEKTLDAILKALPQIPFFKDVVEDLDDDYTDEQIQTECQDCLIFESDANLLTIKKQLIKELSR